MRKTSKQDNTDFKFFHCCTAKQWSLAALSGFLLFLSFPKFGAGLVSWMALVPLLIAIDSASSFRQSLFLGFITGIIGYIGIIYWITYVIVNYGFQPVYVGIMLMLLLACYLSFYVSLFAGCVFYFHNTVSLYLSAPVSWVCFEYLKSVNFTGFPWENLGYAQHSNIYFIQAADIFGVFGLSFLIVLVNVAVFKLFIKRTPKDFISISLVFFVILMVHLYGVYRINQIEKNISRAQEMEVSLIQGNIDQSIKWNPQYQLETLNIYERLTLQEPLAEGGLIVWPETAIPFKFQKESHLRDRIINLAKEKKVGYYLDRSVSSIQSGMGNILTVPICYRQEARCRASMIKSIWSPMGNMFHYAMFYPL